MSQVQGNKLSTITIQNLDMIEDVMMFLVKKQ